jgi:hypothetical protein
LSNSLNQEAPVTFYASLPVSWFSELGKLARNLARVFGSMYACEQAFSHMKEKKLKFHSRITDVILHDAMRIGI